MKKLLLIATFFPLLTFAQIPEPSKNWTNKDDKSMAIRNHFDNYLNNNIDALKSLWRPDLKIYLTDYTESGLQDIVNLISIQHDAFENISFSGPLKNSTPDSKMAIFTINFGLGGYWTYAWGRWTATGKTSGENIEVPVNIVFHWDDQGKIKDEYHFYSPSLINEEIEKFQSSIN